MSDIPSLRILLVEDSSTDAKMVLRELGKQFPSIQSERVTDSRGLHAALEAGPWDIVICDWALPGFSATSALQIVKARGPGIPFIIVSGTVGEESAVEAMRAGAGDYVLKSNLARLPTAVDREVQGARLKAQLRTRSDEDEHFFNLSLDMLAVAGFDGYFKRVNPAWEATLGWTSDEMCAQPWIQFVHPDDVQRTIDAGNKLTAVGESLSEFENRYRTKDGKYRSLSWISFPVVAEKRIYASARDITVRKKLEEQLNHSQKMDAIGGLASGIAHDFNNLLSVILSYTNLLIDDLKPDDPKRADLEEISKAGIRAEGLTRRLLAFGRRQMIAPTTLDLGRLLSGMENMIRRLLTEDIELSVIVAPSLGMVRADAGQLEQVLMNLIINARDAMPAGGKLLIETSNVMLDEAYAKGHVGVRPGPHVLLAVTDTGTGINAEIKGRIFEPFFTTKETGKGTGLGLSTVFGAVQQSGGHILVYSEVGHGTTFKVYLPCTDAVAGTLRTSTETPDLVGTGTILLVEDEEQVRGIVGTILRRAGYTVLEAKNGGEGLLLYEQNTDKIDLLLTDVVMPLMSGRELAERLAALRPNMKVLYMSGYTDNTVLRHGILSEGIAFLQKPITPRSLLSKVREVLGGD
ncbi:MAG: response regulator [Polyangiaceae bacterium]|nr:response regulator [Polyangiaceae bacterium]